MARPAEREPAPLVTRVRRRTVEKVDSIGFVERRWMACSAGKSRKARRVSSSSVTLATALGH